MEYAATLRALLVLGLYSAINCHDKIPGGLEAENFMDGLSYCPTSSVKALKKFGVSIYIGGIITSALLSSELVKKNCTSNLVNYLCRFRVGLGRISGCLLTDRKVE